MNVPASRRRRYLLPGLMSATTVFGLACWAILATEPGCLAAQGHWSSGAGKCHTRLCLLQGNCGEMASPIVHARDGDSRGAAWAILAVHRSGVARRQSRQRHDPRTLRG
ncbi:hypothetical protein KX924_14045 [Streptomyces sp. II-2-2-2]